MAGFSSDFLKDVNIMSGFLSHLANHVKPGCKGFSSL